MASLESVSDVLGWIGAVLLVSAYAGNSFGVFKTRALTYQLLNLVASLFLGFNTLMHAAIPSTVINAIWICIAVVSLVRNAPSQRSEGR